MCGVNADPGIVAAYWRNYELSQGNRTRRLEAEASYLWAWEAVQDALDENDPLSLLDAILDAENADPAYVGAGPVEDLLDRDPEQWDAPIAERCRRSQRWRAAVAAAWLDDHKRSRLTALQPFLASRS